MAGFELQDEVAAPGSGTGGPAHAVAEGEELVGNVGGDKAVCAGDEDE